MATCIKLEWAAPPEVHPCAVGEPADYRGLKIIAVYDNGTRDILDVNFRMFNESDLQVAGAIRKSIVSYEGKRLPVNVPLFNAYLERIEVTPNPDFACYEGEPFDRSKVTVRAFYSNGASREVSHYKVFPFDNLAAETKEISFRYGRSKAILDVSVLPASEKPLPAQDELPSVESFIVPKDNPVVLPVVEEAPAPAPVVPEPPAPVSNNREEDDMGKRVRSISVARMPDKLRYFVGDTEPSLSGGTVTVTYMDGSFEEKAMIPDSPASMDCSKAGRGQVSFSFMGRQVGYPVEVVLPQITKLVVTKMPDKVEYREGEKVDLTGLCVEAVYNDRSTRKLTGFASDIAVSADHELDGIPLEYEGHPINIPIKIKKDRAMATPISASFGSPPDKTVYVEGECTYPDLTGAVLAVQMSDGRRESVHVTQEMVREFDVSVAGPSALVIRYFTFDIRQPILVERRSIQSIVVASGPKKTSYIHNERFDLQGVVLHAVYNNGSKEIVTDYELESYYAAAGATSIVFKYQGKTASFPVTIKALSIVSLDWLSMPNKKTYYTGEKEFSCEGGVLRAKRNDGSYDDIPLTASMVSGFHTDRLGPLPLRISYAGKTIPLSITVQERMLLGLQIVSTPRLEYTVGETFDPTGLVVEALYSGDTREEVSVNYLPYGELNESHDTVMLIHRDKAAVLQIVVKKPDSVIHRPLDVSYGAMRIPPKIVSAEPHVPVVHVAEPEPEPIVIPTPVAAEPAPVQPVVEEQPVPVDSRGGEEALSEPDDEVIDFSDADDQTEAPPAPKAAAAPQDYPIPTLYPSTFCIRFDQDPDEVVSF